MPNLTRSGEDGKLVRTQVQAQYAESTHVLKSSSVVVKNDVYKIKINAFVHSLTNLEPD